MSTGIFIVLTHLKNCELIFKVFPWIVNWVHPVIWKGNYYAINVISAAHCDIKWTLLIFKQLYATTFISNNLNYGDERQISALTSTFELV